MNLQPKHRGRRIRSGFALLAIASAVLLLSPAAQAQRMHGSGGSQFGSHASGGHQFNRGGGSFSGFRHNGVPRGGGHRHGGFGSVVVIGGAGLFYPYSYAYPYYAYAYPYADDSSLIAAPAYNMPPPAPTWYYCDAAGAYYPYVATCPGGWREVPATPNQPAAP